MKKWILRLTLLIGILLILAGTVYAVDWLGIVNIRSKVANVPVINRIMPVRNPAGTGAKTSTAPKNPLVVENDQLKAQVHLLEKKIDKLTATAQQLTDDKAGLEQELSQAKQKIQANQSVQDTEKAQQAKYKQLAAYYANMRAQDAVLSLSKLDDDTLLGIITNMEDDQAAAVLSKLDPARAATIVKKLASNF